MSAGRESRKISISLTSTKSRKGRSKKPYSMTVYLSTVNLTLFGVGALEVARCLPGPWVT
jgi:hypothetical protein